MPQFFEEHPELGLYHIKAVQQGTEYNANNIGLINQIAQDESWRQ